MQTLQGVVDMPWKNRSENDFLSWYDWMINDQSFGLVANFTVDENVKLYKIMRQAVEYGDLK